MSFRDTVKFLVFSAFAVQAFHDCPTDTCSGCLSAEVHDAPGVGFDLTPGYGVSSVHWYNSVTEDVVKVEASDEYKDLIVRLSQAPALDYPGPIDIFKRWLNKKLGRPSTRAVGVLSKLISNLKEKTQAAISRDIDRVAITTPQFPALTHQDITDALEYAGLKSWLDPPRSILYPQLLSESRAAFAANGYGLCKDYKDHFNCQDEEEDMPRETVYYVSLSRDALYTSLSSYTAPFGWEANYEPYDFDEAAGTDKMSAFPDEATYWAHVRQKLIPRRTHLPITKLLIGGEAANVPEFREALREALADASTNSLEIREPVRPIFAAARGAALYARWRQEAPFGCVEDRACGERRDRERSSMSHNRGQAKAEL